MYDVLLDHPVRFLKLMGCLWQLTLLLCFPCGVMFSGLKQLEKCHKVSSTNGTFWDI